MSSYALVRTVGSLSAGTRVTVREQPGKTRATYMVATESPIEIVQHRTFTDENKNQKHSKHVLRKEYQTFEVKAEDLVQLRPRTR